MCSGGGLSPSACQCVMPKVMFILPAPVTTARARIEHLAAPDFIGRGAELAPPPRACGQSAEALTQRGSPLKHAVIATCAREIESAARSSAKYPPSEAAPPPGPGSQAPSRQVPASSALQPRPLLGPSGRAVPPLPPASLLCARAKARAATTVFFRPLRRARRDAAPLRYHAPLPFQEREQAQVRPPRGTRAAE